MHTGVIAAINIGVTLVIGAALAAFLIWHRRRSKVHEVPNPHNDCTCFSILLLVS